MSARELPAEQQQEGVEEAGELMPMERAQEISEQFADIESRTISEGVVNGRILTIDTTTANGAMSIDIDVPAEPDPVNFTMSKPKSWDQRFEFVRFVEHYGYGASNFAAMIEDGVEVAVNYDPGRRDEYELVIPDYAETTDRYERAKTHVKAVLRKIADDFDPSEGVIMVPAALTSLWFGVALALGMVMSGEIFLMSVWATAVGVFMMLCGMFVTVIIGEAIFDW